MVRGGKLLAVVVTNSQGKEKEEWEGGGGPDTTVSGGKLIISLPVGCGAEPRVDKAPWISDTIYR